MTVLELRLRESLSSERIEDISIEQLTQSVSQLIAQTYIMVGYQTYNERDIGILAAKLSSDLRESYAHLTLPPAGRGTPQAPGAALRPVGSAGSLMNVVRIFLKPAL